MPPQGGGWHAVGVTGGVVPSYASLLVFAGAQCTPLRGRAVVFLLRNGGSKLPPYVYLRWSVLTFLGRRGRHPLPMRGMCVGNGQCPFRGRLRAAAPTVYVYRRITLHPCSLLRSSRRRLYSARRPVPRRRPSDSPAAAPAPPPDKSSVRPD